MWPHRRSRFKEGEAGPSIPPWTGHALLGRLGAAARGAGGWGGGAKGVGHGEGARPLPPRISAGHKRGGATLLLCENCPAGPPIFFEPVFLLKEPFSLFLSLFPLKRAFFSFLRAKRLKCYVYAHSVLACVTVQTHTECVCVVYWYSIQYDSWWNDVLPVCTNTYMMRNMLFIGTQFSNRYRWWCLLFVLAETEISPWCSESTCLCVQTHTSNYLFPGPGR